MYRNGSFSVINTKIAGKELLDSSAKVKPFLAGISQVK